MIAQSPHNLKNLSKAARRLHRAMATSDAVLQRPLLLNADGADLRGALHLQRRAWGVLTAAASNEENGRNEQGFDGFEWEASYIVVLVML